MTAMSTETFALHPDDAAYNTGFLDGELDAVSKLPAAIAMARVRMATQYDPMWAQGYDDGFLHAIALNYSQQHQQEGTRR